MVGTPESIPFFEQAMQLARRSLGLQYEAMQFGDEFCEVCRELFLYQYTKTRMELSAGVTEWLFEHCGGNISVLVSLIHDAQEIAILEGDDVLDMAMLEQLLPRLAELAEPVALSLSGSTLRVPCGTTTWTMLWYQLRPVERAASRWPFGTDSMPARKISAK